MEPASLLLVLAAYSNTLLWMWLVYLAVMLAGVAVGPQVRAFRLFVAGLAFFAVTHLMCLQWVLKQWGAVAAVFKERVAADTKLREMLDGAGFTEAPDFLWVVPFHLLADVLFLGGLWRLGRRPAGQ